MPPETLIDGYTFFVTTRNGGIGSEGGLYHRDTRYLSALNVDVADADVTPVGQTLNRSNRRTLTLATAGPAVNEISEENVAKHTDLVVTREQSVHEGAGYAETLSVDSHLATDRHVEVRISFATDFADLFEVRGLESDIDRVVHRTVAADSVTMSYGYETAGGSSVERSATVHFDRAPDTLSAETATFELTIPAQSRAEIPFMVTFGVQREGMESSDRGEVEAAGADLGRNGSSGGGFQEGADGHEWASPGRADREGVFPRRTAPLDLPTIETGGPYDAVFDRAAGDLTALTTETPEGPVSLAGTPWFGTPFGRDAILTAHQTIAVAPELAEGTLRYFAARQGTQRDDAREEARGKIFHEIRHGELADRELIPHTPYFGTVDATPLWVMLLAETCRWQGNESLAVELAPSLRMALDWILQASSATADDPFVYYSTEQGVLDHKAWKDTADSIRFADGEVAKGPLAVAEVQGYAAAALEQGADVLERVAESLGESLDVDPYRLRASAIESAFDREFWVPEREFYALAKDGNGRIVDAVTSNVGHCLWTETIPDHRVDTVVETLISGPLSADWGVRTMSPRDAGYSPVSYHAGGIWPHDTSLVALGLAKNGHGDAAEELARGVLDAATHFEHCRLPELYCGFGGERDPVEYPAACTPQAWAAAAPYAFLQAMFRPKPTGTGVQIQRSSSLFSTSVSSVFT